MDRHRARIVIIPARGGSKGVPRKNLRPLAGRPLLGHSLAAAAALQDARVVVSTDDEEIAVFARRHGAEIHDRSAGSSDDAATVDDVVVECLLDLAVPDETVVLTVQATSPFISIADLEAAHAALAPGIDTVVSVTDDTHLRWRVFEDGTGEAMFDARVNRQWLPREFRETGAVVASRAGATRSRGTRFGDTVHPLVLSPERSLDVDTDLDFRIAEALLGRRRVALVVIGGNDVGLGHVYRQLSIANDLVGHDVRFVLDQPDETAVELVRDRNYPVEVCATDDELYSYLAAFAPDLIVNDCLDSSEERAKRLAGLAVRTASFEDLGPGASIFDVVVNALYEPSDTEPPSVRSGPSYFVARDEFVTVPRMIVAPTAEHAMITFGGVDEGNLTCRTLAVLADVHPGATVTVVLGRAYAHDETLAATVAASPLEVEVVRDTRAMSELMAASDVLITGGGRTVYEGACVAVPTVSVSQNDREVSHAWSREQLGVLDLGLAADLDDDHFAAGLIRACDDLDWRFDAHERSLRANLTSGRARVIKLLTDLMEQS